MHFAPSRRANRYEITNIHAPWFATVHLSIMTKYDPEALCLEHDAWPTCFSSLTCLGHMSRNTCVKQTTHGSLIDGMFAVITWSYLARLALVFAMQSTMLSNSYEATLFCVGLCVRASGACKMACVQHASHTHEEAHADVVAILKFEGTHNASQISHHNLHLLCHVCRVLVA